MAKQLNVSLAFTANTNEAIAAIKNLQKELNGLATGKSLKMNGIQQLTPEIQRAMVAAGELQAKLEAATNLKTGKLDLSQFSESLKKGGISLQQYANQLNALGPAGRQAFTNLASSIIQAEAPLIRCNQRVKELGTTLANTARWQMSSSVLHSFMGTIQSAYGYAQDLNKSLNDIRIVTGASVSEMDAFAEKANKAARALSTTTNEYAKASLIYFQQGDTQAQAMDKAAITTKMANVTGQSAEVVSNQLTAIWNNFNKEGDVAYEHYADVLTKLGAATASSTDEIAGGLEKFAGIANQIGLSYEYAASALATITATSRESEDVVGTALKTIFARIQGLNLGETLDDGTTLNKYSDALNTIGVSIFDQAGQLKDMDDILEEMADKWKTLNRDQQTALAQTVAGVRQYNQLMTLMNNWDVMDNNLAMSFSADGSLQEQADIYAESWRAARDEVSAAAEELYSKILDDDFFIGLLNGLEIVIDGVSGLIDAFGGLHGILLTIGSLASRIFHDEIVKGLKNTAYNLKQLTPAGKQEQDKAREEAVAALKQMKLSSNTQEGQAENNALMHEVSMQEQLMQNAKKLTDEELKQLQIQMDLVRALDDRAVAAAKNADAAKQELEHMQTMNKLQAQMDAKLKARTNSKSKGEANFTDRAFKAANSGGRKTLVEQYYKQQKHAAEAQVRQAHNLDPKADLSGFESEVRAAFVNGIREAAKADGASEIAQKVGKELEQSISIAMSGASKKMSEEMAKARREVEAYDKQINKAAQANVAAGSLNSTVTNLTASMSDEQDAKKLIELQEILKRKIIETKNAAEQLGGSLGDEDLDIQLNEDIKELEQLSRQLESTTLDANQLNEILSNLGSGDQYGMTIGERIQLAADISGTSAEQEGTSNLEGKNVNFEGHYEAAKKKAQADNDVDAAKRNSDKQKKMFEEKLDSSGGVQDWADGIANATSVISSLGATISSVQGLIDTFNNPDASAWDRLGAVFGVLMTILPALPPLFSLVGSTGAAAGTGITAAMGPVGWVILGITAAIAGLTLGLSAIADAYNADAIAASRAQEAIEECAESQSELNQEVQNLESTINAYDSAVEKLEKCTKGTDEWKEALQEVNVAANDVINSLDSLDLSADEIKALYNTDKGYMELNKNTLANYQTLMEKRANSASYAASASKIYAENKADSANLLGEIRQLVANQNALARNGYGTFDKEGKSYGEVNEESVRSAILENADEWLNLSDTEFANKLKELGINVDNLSNDTLLSFKKSVENIANSAEAASEKLLLIAKIQVEDELGDQYDEATKAMVSNQLADRTTELTDNWLNYLTSNSGESYDLGGTFGLTNSSGINKGSSSNNQVYKDALAALQAAGYKWTADTGNAILGNDQNRRFIFRDEKGEKTAEKSAEWIAQTIAATQALSELSNNAVNAASALSGMEDKVGENSASAIKSMITSGNLNTLTKSELSQLQSSMGGADNSVSSDEAINYLRDAFSDTGLIGEELDSYIAEMFGANNISEVGQSWSEIISGTEERWTQISNGFVQKVSEILNSIDTSKLSMQQTESLGNLLTQAFNNGGDQGVQDFKNILNTMFDNVGDDADELIDVLSNIDWQTASVSDLTALLDNAGIETDGFADKLAELIGLMKEGQNVGFDAAVEHYSSMKDFAKLEEDDSIEQADIDLLEAAGVDTSRFFKLMGDGSYQLCNDAEEFYRIVNEKSLDVFKTNLDSLYENRDSANAIVGNYTSDNITSASTSAKVDFLSALGVENENLASYQQMTEFTTEQIEEINRLVEENKDRLSELPEKVQAINAEIEKHQEAMANSATSVDELNRLQEQGYITAQQYGNAVKKVMETEFEAEGLDADAANDVADAFREMADAGVEGMEALRNDEEAVKDATVRYMKLNEAIEDIYDYYDDYTDVLKDVRNATSKADRAMAANTNSAKKLKTSMAGLLGTTEDMIDADFLATIDPDDFKAAANGNAEAIERIRNQFIDLQAQMYGCEGEADAFKQRLAELADGAYIDLNTDPFLSKLIQAAVDAGATASEIESMLSGFGIDADVTPFVENLNAAVGAASEAGGEIANATSFTTEVDQEAVDNTRTVENPQFDESVSVTHRYGWNQVSMNGGFGALTYPSIYAEAHKSVNVGSSTDEFTDTSVVTGQTVTNGEGKSGKGGVTIKNAHKATTPSKTPSASNTSRPPVGSKGGGGGGSNPKAPSKIDKRDMTQKSDVVQRYREIDDSIDNVTDALTRADQAASRLWGKDKINAMKEENKLLKQQYKLIQDKAEQAREYAEEDYAELMRAASEAGISLVVDRATGDITNIEDGLDTLYDRLESAEKEYNKKVEEYNNAVLAATKSDGTVSESDSKRLETMKEALDAYEEDFIGGIEDDIEAVQNAEKQFQESVETWEQAGLDMESILDSIMQNNYDIIMEGLEIPLSLNEEDLRYIELKLSQIEDDMYSMSEAVALTSSELSEYKDNLHLADEALAELNRAHEAGEITDAAYQEGLGEIRDKYYENVESLMELDKTMKEYYSNTLDMANEELSKYTDQMEHQTSVLEHYQSLIELMGKSADYKMIGKILEGQVETTKNSMEVSKQWYETQRNNADALAAEYAAALANNASEAELEIIKANWEAAEASANEAQDQMLSDAEAWAEALKAVLENELADLSQTLENALTGGTSFDTLTTQMERAASLQEEYLTTTNQIYETNKLMRTAQQEIDKTTNAVAKKKLKAYINETEQLQNQSKLSQYELEIQQAKYNLLLAEIALQEAQDAKSTVRLQRDSEGNFGYVYTADSNKINEAQQKLEDAQNDLYNKGLDGANDYAQKYQQTMQEMYDTLADIQQRHLDGEYETEAEYQAAMEEAKAYYYQKLQDYSSLYSVAVTADSRVVADAWSTDFASMIYDTDNWKQAVEDYTDDAIAAFTKWQNAITGEGGIADLIGNSVEDVGKTVQEVTDKSKELAKKTQEEVIPALDKELDSVNNLTGAYAKMRDTIKETIEYYTNMINRINNSQTSDWNNGSEGSDDSSTPEDGGSGNGGGNSDTIPGGQDDGQGEGSPDTIPGGSPEGEGGSGISYHSGTLKFSGSGANRVWTDASGKTYAYGSPEQKAFQKAFDKAYGRNGGYKGDYWIGWSGDGGKLNADVLHEKYGLATGGYTGDWAGSYGKLAFLHQKELVLNAQDTENFLASMEVMERILQVIDMQSANAQLGGILSSPGFNSNNSQVIEQSVHIEASFPGVQDRSEIEEAFNNLINKASQYANRK